VNWYQYCIVIIILHLYNFFCEYSTFEEYFEFLIGVMSSLVNFDIMSLGFHAKIDWRRLYFNGNEDPNDYTIAASHIIQTLFKIVNNFSCLRNLSITSNLYGIDATLSDLLSLLINNKTINTITLDGIYDIDTKLFTDTHFFDNNTSLFGMYYTNSNVSHEGFNRNKRNYVDSVRLNKTKAIVS
jgi:hypothetical protein